MTRIPLNLRDWEARAILDGRLTQLRRVAKFDQSRWDVESENGVSPEGYAIIHRYLGHGEHEENLIKSPFGAPGTRLWGREAWAPKPWECGILYRINGGELRWRPAQHMPREYSRIELETVGVRIGRVQELSYDDAIARGIENVRPVCAKDTPFDGPPLWRNYGLSDGHWLPSAVESYKSLVEREDKGSWDRNDWVWIGEVRRVKP